MAFEIQPRQSLIVYTYSLKQTRQLKRYGTVMYVSKKMRYVVLYVDQADVASLTDQLNHLRFVKRVVRHNGQQSMKHLMVSPKKWRPQRRMMMNENCSR